jgi:thioredoxin reductase (NADPH)
MVNKMVFFKNNVFLSVGGFAMILLTCGCFNKESAAEKNAHGVVRNALPRRHYDIQSITTTKNIVPALIIGSGPAGLSAALYASREHVLTVVTHGHQPGGLLTDTTVVENWPGELSIMGPDIVQKMQAQVTKFGTYFIDESVASIDTSAWPFIVTMKDGTVLNALAIVVATGATPKKLGIPGEAEYEKLGGVSACAVCDAWRFKNKNVMVIGGGDSSAEEAMQLASHVNKVTILVRKERMRASLSMQERLKGYPNVSVRYLSEPVALVGNGKQLTGVEIVNPDTKTRETIPTDGVFLAIGHVPNSQVCNHIRQAVNVDGLGFIELEGRSQETSVAGIFAAGDVTDPVYRQAGVAAGDGIKAGMDLLAFLRSIGFDARWIREHKSNFYVPNEEDAQPEDMQTVQTNVSADESNGVLEQEESADEQEFALIHEIKDATELEAFLILSDRPVVVDFFTTDCSGCKKLLPAVEEVAKEFAQTMVFAKINLDVFPEVGEQYAITHVPVLLIFNKGVVTGRHVGFMTKGELKDFLESSLL